MSALLCFFFDHRWRPYWTPGRTWVGRRCDRCHLDEYGFNRMVEAFYALPASDPLRRAFDDERARATEEPQP